jgi:hypothetical protein
MVSLYELATQIQQGDRIRWKGEDSDVTRPRPRTVQSVESGPGYVMVQAKGPKGGNARFRAEQSGYSRAWYGAEEESMGAVENAELVDKGVQLKPWDASESTSSRATE